MVIFDMGKFQHHREQIESEAHHHLAGFDILAIDQPFQTILEEFCAALLATLNAMSRAIRQFHPPLLSQINSSLSPVIERLEIAKLNLVEYRKLSGQTKFLSEQLIVAGDYAEQATQLFINPSEPRRLFLQILRAIRRYNRAQEALFPLRYYLMNVSRYFLEPSVKHEEDWVKPIPPDGIERGIITISQNQEEADPYWLYVPDRYDGLEPLPLVIALHGGGGTGRDFIWSWIREARSRNFMLLAPSSKERTWSFQCEDDEKKIKSVVQYISERWRLNHQDILLTGFSDGAIYALTCGIKKNSLYAALAPISGVLHPVDLEYALNRRVYLVHGQLDFMFQIEHAYRTHAILEAAGADIVFHEIEDLSHTYPSEENAAILSWFSPALSL